MAAIWAHDTSSWSPLSAAPLKRPHFWQRCRELPAWLSSTILFRFTTDLGSHAKMRRFTVWSYRKSRSLQSLMVSSLHLFTLSLITKGSHSECCMSGCAVCIYDLYEDSLFTYKASLASLRAQLKSMGVPQSEWPPRVRSSPSSHASQRSPNTSLDAFEAMEKALKAKQQGRIEGGS